MSDLNEEVDTSANDDLRSSLEAAFDTPDTPSEVEEPKSDRPRDESGRFAKAEKASAAPEKPAHDDEPSAGTEPVSRKMPASWSKDNQVLWDTLTPAHQDVILKREADFHKGFEEKAAKFKPWERIEQLIQPVAAKYKMQGISEDMLVERLLTAHNMLENPQTRDQAWQFLLQQYGMPQFLNQQPSQQFQPQQPNPYDQRLSQIEGLLRQQQEAQLYSHVESFAKDHPHFEQAAEHIEKLLRSGKASDLNEAYEMAIWLNPDLRNSVLEDQAKEKVAAQASKTAQAKKAASSVTGAPTGTGSSGAPRASLRDELEAAFDRF